MTLPGLEEKTKFWQKAIILGELSPGQLPPGTIVKVQLPPRTIVTWAIAT